MNRRGKRLSGKMPMVRATSGHFLPWDRRAIVKSLLKETALAKEFLGTPAISKRRAEEIALKVERKVGGMDLKFVSGPLIREIVNNILLEEFGNPDYRVYRNIMTRVGTPVYDAFEIDIGVGFESKENANLQPNAESLPPDEVVVIDLGCGFKRLPIGEVIDQLMDEHHGQVERRSGTEVLQLNGDLKVLAFNERLQVEPMPATAVIRHGGKEIYRVKLENGREVRTSADHNLFVPQGGELVSVPLSELSVGDCVAVPANIRRKTVISKLNVVERLLKNCNDEELKLLYLRSEQIPTIIRQRRREVERFLEETYGECPINYRHPSRREVTRRIIPLWKYKKTLPLLVWKYLRPGLELTASARIGTWRTKRTHEFPAILELSHDLGLILGLLISEGWLGKRQISIETPLRSGLVGTKVTFSNKDEKIIQEFLGAWQRAFGSPRKIQSGNGVKRIVVGTRPLSYFLEKGLEVNVTTSRQKDVPTWLFKAPSECIAGFLRGLYLGDGKMSGASLSTTSQRLSEGVALLMLCLGVYPRIQKQKGGYENVVYVGGSSALRLKELTRLPLTDQQDIEYADTIPGLATTLDALWRSIRWGGWSGKAQRAVAMLSRWTRNTAPTRRSLKEFVEIVKVNASQYDEARLKVLESFANSDIRFEKIVKIEGAGFAQHLYDFEVRPGGREVENFLGGSGFICLHNTAHKKKADKTSKEEYLLLMPMGQSDAHLSGDIHIHDLEYFGTRPFCQNWDLRYFFYYGFMPDGLGFKTSVAGPAKRPEVAVLHSVKVLAAAQTNFSGGEGFYNYLVFLAPYMRGLGYDGMKQLMQMMFFELTQMYVARGGQPVFSNIQIMPSVPEIWSDMPVVHGGKVGPDTYGSYQDEVRLLYRAINEVALKGDYWGKPFNFPKLENGITPGTFGPEVEDELLLTHEIAAKFGSPYFDNMIPEYRGYGKGVSCYQCLAGDELVPVVGDRDEVQVRRIEDLFDATAKNGLETDPNGVEFAGLRARTPSIDFKTLKGSLKAFHGVMRKKYKGKLLNVTLTSGRRIRITPDHPVFVLEKGTFVKRLARDLNVGDFLPVLKSADFGTKWVHVLDVGEILNNAGFASKVIMSEDEVNLKNAKKAGLPKLIPVSSELIHFLGYYLAEGCSDHHGRRYSVRLSFGKHETDLIDDALRCLRTLGFNSYISIEKTASNVVVNSKLLYLLMEALGCGHNAYDKSVPDLLFNVKSSLVGKYISCAFQGDGNINVQVNELEGYAHAAHGISMRLVSRDAIQKLVFLAQRIGVQMNYMARDETVKHPQTGESYELTSYTCYITSQDQIKRFYHDTGYGKDAVSDNGRNTGGTFTRIPIKESAISYSGLQYPSQYRSKKYNAVNQRLILEDAKVGTLRKLIEGDIHPLMIRDIVEDDYGGYVYDLVEVSDNHNFSNALGILIGNCCSYNFVETSETDDEFKEKMHFSEGAHFSMGSWQVVTLNLPRAAYRARGEDERLFEELRGLMDLSIEVFETKRRWMDLMLKNDRMPFATQRPMDPSGGRRGPPAVDFEELVYTIGLVGTNEMAQYHTGSQLHESDESVKFAVRALLEMKKHLGLLRERTGMKLALARTPAESCAQRLAVCDLLSDELRDRARVTVKGDLEAARKMLGQGGRDVPVYYTNGTHVYVGARMPLMERMRIENKFFPILNGGNMFHVWLGERDPDPESLLRMTKRISTQSQIGYFAYTRDLTICEDCNKVEGGVHRSCPSCRSPRVRWWSRVTGYYQDVGGWNSGKREEFLRRFRTDIPRGPMAS